LLSMFSLVARWRKFGDGSQRVDVHPNSAEPTGAIDALPASPTRGQAADLRRSRYE
jgi:hypothetical protein